MFGFGKVGRAALQPIIQREHSTSDDESLDESLRAALSAVLVLLRGDLPDITSFSTTRRPGTVTVFSDASCEPCDGRPFGQAVVAYVVFFPSGRVVYASLEVPDAVLSFLDGLKNRRTPICVLEEVALVAPYFHPELRDVFQTTLPPTGVALKGYSSSEDIARLVFSYHVRLVHMQTRVWVEYVPSAANIADDPTRGEFDRLTSVFHAERLEFVLPPMEGWAPAAAAAVHA